MQVSRSDLVAREGVHFVGYQTVRELGWVFREQPIPEYGIDAQLELVQAGKTSGNLIAVQIKSGRSYFTRSDEIGFLYYGRPEHLEYWSAYAIPVVIVLYDPSVQEAYWQAVADESVTRTEHGWHIAIPVAQRFDFSATSPLIEVAHRRFDILAKTRRLVQAPLYELALDREELRVEVRERVNDVSGRGDLRIFISSPDGQERIVADWTPVFFGETPYEQALHSLFPWADLAIDEEFYPDHEKKSPPARRAFAAELRPYHEDEEIAKWRLKLTANAVHEAHRIMETLPEDDPQRIRWFELLEDAEMSHQAEGYLRAEAERIRSALGWSR
jgi:hypothetical protein